jgi:Tfp pilus assembly protein PilO
LNLDDLKLQWQALEGWKKLAVIIIFTGAIIYLIYMFKLEPLMVEKEKLGQDVQQLKNEISFLKKHAVPQKIIEIQKKIEQINNEIKSKQLELENLKTIIPDKAEIDKILNFVTYNVSASNLILNKFNVSKEETVYLSYNCPCKYYYYS